MNEPSIFTRIINGEIPCDKIFEDDKTMAFLDIHPSVEGHTLVIPKTEVEFLWDLSDEDYKAVWTTARTVARHLRETLGVKYVGIKVVGTDVPHTHIHLIPFNTKEEYSLSGNLDSDPDYTSLSELAQKLAF